MRNRRKHKAKVLTSCVIPEYMYALDAMALTEKHQEKVNVCENN